MFMNLKITSKALPRLRKTWTSVILILFCIAMSSAQTVKGTVTSEGQPIPLATI